jgi:uncharacterized membrane protein
VTLAGVTVAAMGLMMNAVAISIGLNAARIEDGAVIQLFNDVSGATEILMSLPLSAIVAFTSWALLKDHGAMRWIGLAGLLVAALLVIRSLVLVGGPRLPFPPLYPLWFEVLAVGVAIREAA